MKQTYEEKEQAVIDLADRHGAETLEKFGLVGSTIFGEIAKLMATATLMLEQSGEFARSVARQINEVEDLLDAQDKEEE